MTKRLIVSADDFGMSPGVNAGIMRAHRYGILGDASLMVNGTGFDEAVEMARATPSLSVGLHLTLVQGRATAAHERIPLLADRQGMFGNNAIWNGMRYFFLPGVRQQLEAEIAAQLEKFTATGLPLSHVDGHMTMHVHPTVLGILARLADQYGIRTVRLPREPLLPALRFDRRHGVRKLFEGFAFTALSRLTVKRLRRAGIRYPDRMFGLHQTGHVSEKYLLEVLRRLPDGTSEVYCHAAIVDEEARRWRPAKYESEQELQALTSPRVKATIEQEGIERITYHDLA